METRSAAQRFHDKISENLKAVGLEQLEAEPMSQHARSQSKDRLRLSPSEPSATLVSASTAAFDDDQDMGRVSEVDESPIDSENEEMQDGDSPMSPKLSKNRAASSVYSGTPPMPSYMSFASLDLPTEPDDFDVLAYPDVQAFLADMKSLGYATTDDPSWRLNPVLGPASELDKLEKLDRQPFSRESSPRPKPRNPHIGAVPRVWLAVWTNSASRRRLALVLTKTSAASPVVIASPLPLHLVPPPLLATLVHRLCLKLKTIFPPSLFTPGGTSIKTSFLSPMNNVYACLGPGPLVQLFSQTWSALCNSETGSTSSHPLPTQGTLNSPVPSITYRLRKAKLTHVPKTFVPTSMPLMTGFAVRIAQPTDDLKSLAKLLRDYRVEINPSNREHVSYDACLRDIDKAVRAGHVFVYEVSSKTMPGLRFYPGLLKVGSETETSIAIVEFYTGPAWRKRGVAESLLRETIIHYLSFGGKKQILCLLDDVAEAAGRVCARVGLRVLERSRWEETPAGEDEGQRVRRDYMPTENAYLSWERYMLARFTAVAHGVPWHQVY